MDLSKITSCSLLTEDVFALASRSSDTTKELLAHIARISKPHDGEIRILFFLSRVALQNWIDGDLRLTIQMLDLVNCRFRLMRNIGGDQYEVIIRFEANVSFTELRNAGAERKNILPFRLSDVVDMKQLIFDADVQIRRTTTPPPEFAQAVVCAEERSSWLQPPVPDDLAHAVFRPKPKSSFRTEEPATTRFAKIPLKKIPVRSLPPLPLIGSFSESEPVTRKDDPRKEAETDPAPKNTNNPDDIDDGWE